MQSKATTAEDYIATLPEDRKMAMTELRNVILNNIPKGFKEVMNYGMLCYVVPHSIYPNGLHSDPKQPLPFMGLASQKNFVTIHHMGVYAEKNLLSWFTNEYGKQGKSKLDMGKSCIRFKKIDQIPFKLIGELASKMTPQEWITVYERGIKK